MKFFDVSKNQNFKTTLNGNYYKETATFEFKHLEQSQDLQIDVCAVDKSTEYLEYRYDGVIGLSSHLLVKDKSLLSDSVQKNEFIKDIVSIYTAPEYGSSSKIEFGGWDWRAVAPGAEMEVYDAPNDLQWDMLNMMIDDKLLIIEETVFGMKMEYNPKVMYDPVTSFWETDSVIWKIFALQFNDLFKPIQENVCKELENYKCIFNTKCDAVIK